MRQVPVAVLLYAFSLAAAVAYACFFSWLSIQRYDAFLMHALDMGNMDQAVWNTLHGNLFHFTNMEAPLAKEAWGTTTRLSFHVEPILLPLSLSYLIHAGPETLIVLQAAIVALGAPAACRLALRVSGSAALALAATITYLLFPALQAATLYEFHAVTLTAPFLLWAIVFLEGRRYWWFVVFAALAVACKEEIGLVVAALCLWDWWRRGAVRITTITAIVATLWSIVAVLAIVPHFAGGPSAYWQRYIDASAAGGTSSAGPVAVLRTWLQHPDRLFHTVVIWPKLGMMHRYLVSTGYLSLFGLPLLLTCLPSLAIILLSTDQHMYGGLAQYSAELVPIGVAASIYGAVWLSRWASAKFGFDRRLATTLFALWLAVMALANQHANGFSPLADGYAAPTITAHARLGAQLLKLIPPGAPVSSMDQLDPHLGDRAESYLFPDVSDAQYVALDVTTNVNPGTPADQYAATEQLLQSRHWEILAADDGYLILHRVARLLPAVPRIPAGFFTFALSAASGTAAPIAQFGPDLQLLSVHILRYEQITLRVPDVVMVTTWRVVHPLPSTTSLQELVANPSGRIDNRFTDRLTTDWLPMSTWRPGQIVTVRSRQISIVQNYPGLVGLRLQVVQLSPTGHTTALVPRLLADRASPIYNISGTTLQVAQADVSF